MIFNKHLELKGKHALFSPSQPAWLRYDEGKLVDRLYSQYAAAIGTCIHEYAAMQITLKHKITSKRALTDAIEDYVYQKFYDEDYEEVSAYGQNLLNVTPVAVHNAYETIKSYVNDAITFKMTPEQPLIFSDEFFGTADAISFDDGVLRIHDLKTGVSGEIEQLEVYAALFCLEYDVKPIDISIELRLYKQNEVLVFEPTIEDLAPIMDIISTNAKFIADAKKQGGWQ